MIELCCENLSSNAPYRIEMHRTELNLLKDKLKTSKKAYGDVFCVKKKYSVSVFNTLYTAINHKG